MKAVISNRIYFKYDKSFAEKLKNALTYKIEEKVVAKGGGTRIKVQILKTYIMHPGDVISIPRGRLDLIPDGFEIVDKTVEHSVPFPEPKLLARPDQQKVIDAISSDAFINAKVGWGKTFTALLLAHKLGQKTLIITHNTMLRDQWIIETEKLFGHSPGIIGSKIFDINDHFIVIGNVQSVTKISSSINKEFGTIILDEAHHCPAETFSSIIDSSYARYKIGLSGTMKRKDGRHILLTDYFGNNIIKPDVANTVNPSVEIVKTGMPLAPGQPWAKKINTLLYDKDYQEYVALQAAKKISEGHSVLIIADRVEFLENVQKLLGEDCVLVTGTVNTTAEEREKVKELINSRQKVAVAGSRQIFSEGISIDALSCVILATPIANEENLEQIIGRIMRIYPNKQKPVVVDLNFSGSTDRKQNNIRLGFYMKQGWDIKGN